MHNLLNKWNFAHSELEKNNTNKKYFFQTKLDQLQSHISKETNLEQCILEVKNIVFRLYIIRI